MKIVSVTRVPRDVGYHESARDRVPLFHLEIHREPPHDVDAERQVQKRQRHVHPQPVRASNTEHYTLGI